MRMGQYILGILGMYVYESMFLIDSNRNLLWHKTLHFGLCYC